MCTSDWLVHVVIAWAVSYAIQLLLNTYLLMLGFLESTVSPAGLPSACTEFVNMNLQYIVLCHSCGSWPFELEPSSLCWKSATFVGTECSAVSATRNFLDLLLVSSLTGRTCVVEMWPLMLSVGIKHCMYMLKGITGDIHSLYKYIQCRLFTIVFCSSTSLVKDISPLTTCPPFTCPQGLFFTFSLWCKIVCFH